MQLFERTQTDLSSQPGRTGTGYVRPAAQGRLIHTTVHIDVRCIANEQIKSYASDLGMT